MSNSETPEAGKATSAADQIPTPLLAVLGAGNLAGQAIAGAVGKAKERAAESSETVRKNLGELPTDAESLRGKLDPTELKKAFGEYSEGALKLYNKLAESGEQVWEKIAAQPQVKKAFEQLEEALQTAQERFGEVAGEARTRVDDVLGKVTKRSSDQGADKSADKTTDKPATPNTATNVPEDPKPGTPAEVASKATPPPATNLAGEKPGASS